MASRPLVLRLVFPSEPEAQSASQASDAVDSQSSRQDGPESSQHDGSNILQPSGSLPSEHNSSQPFGQDHTESKLSNAEESTAQSSVTSDEPPEAAQQSTEESASSYVAHRTSDETPDNTYTHNENEKEDWADGGDDEEEQEDDDDDENDNDDDGDDDDDDSSGLFQPTRTVWLSETEKMRVALKRLLRTAEKRGFGRSPFLPTTAAEYVGLRADMVDAKAARLRAKIEERERELHAQEHAQWKTVLVVGAGGQIETKLVPVYYSAPEQGRPDSPGALAQPCWHPVPYFPHPAPVYVFPATPWPYSPSLSMPSFPTSTLNPAAAAWSQPSCFAAQGADAPDQVPRGFTLGPSLLPAQPRRISSIPLLRRLASHATLRRGIVQEQAEGTDTDRNFQWFCDDDESSDAGSFTPSDYQPGNQSANRECRGEDTSDDLQSDDYLADNEHNAFPTDNEDRPAWSDSSFTPTLYRTKPNKKGKDDGGSSNNSSSSDRASPPEGNLNNKNANDNHNPAVLIPPPARRLPLATLPLSYSDGLSPVLARPNPFNPSAALSPECDWPSYAEYTSEGDARVRQRTPKVKVTITVTSPGRTTTTAELAQGPVCPRRQPRGGGGGGGHCHQPRNSLHDGETLLGRFLPVPRLRAAIDPRLGLAPDEVASYVAREGSGGRIPWEVRAMVPDRWDFHRERRVSDAWDRGYAGARAWGGSPFWDMVEEEHGGELAGLRIVRELLGDDTYTYHDDEDGEGQGPGRAWWGEEEEEEEEQDSSGAGSCEERVEEVVGELLEEVQEVLRQYGGAY
ncbi:uncharacterized protein B0T15DRAFT_494826 [Chaetomium strumarium]|uniref:Uncharacterized protein n=1 Tax=Chaetomium strumarium TaxID=1170767 RepID=A0AAJ0GQR6_9PEZI|nr:hypothetical protein B0T15DRAFT_494826 [Chaetomium strumarium]